MALNYQQHDAHVFGANVLPASDLRRRSLRLPRAGESARPRATVERVASGLRLDADPPAATTPRRRQAAEEKPYPEFCGGFSDCVSLSPACYTQEEIADKENVDTATVNRIWCEFADLQKRTKSEQSAAEHATDSRAVDAPQRLVVPTRHLEPVARSLANGAQPSGIVVDAAATRNAPEPMKGLER